METQNNPRYIIRSTYIPEVTITTADTLEKAKKIVRQYIAEDKFVGVFEPDFYQIYDTELKKVINDIEI
jgi:hypothetical protein